MLDNIRVLTHSSIKIEIPKKEKNYTVYIDPYNIKSETHDADIILITHSHYDHFSPDDISKIIKKDISSGKNYTKIFMPFDEHLNNNELQNYGLFQSNNRVEFDTPQLSALNSDIYNVTPNHKYEIDDILTFETVAAYNENKKFHPKENKWVGYILSVNGIEIYIAGDTDVTPENQNIKCDIALVPIGGTYTMNITDAACLINNIKPQYAIPTHYGSVVGDTSLGRKFAELVKKPTKVILKMEY